MNDQARDALHQVIRAYGVGICQTPRSCEMFIRQACGAYPDESKALIEALRQGVTSELWSYKPAERPWEEFSWQLSSKLRSSGLGESEGAWAVDTWARALGRHPDNYVPFREVKPVYTSLTPQGPDRSVRIAMAVIVSLGGGIGGFSGSVLVPAAFLITTAAMDMPLMKSITHGSRHDIWLMVILALTILGSFGGIAGTLGALGGWMFGRGDRGHWNAFLSAMGGGFISAALGSYFCGPLIGAPIAALFGTFGASMRTAARGGLA